jgi:hypothetical protein
METKMQKHVIRIGELKHDGRTVFYASRAEDGERTYFHSFGVFGKSTQCTTDGEYTGHFESKEKLIQQLRENALLMKYYDIEDSTASSHPPRRTE